MKVWIALATVILLAACGEEPPVEATAEGNSPNRAEMVDAIGALRAQAFEQDVRLDRAVGHDLMKKYIAFANAFPKDSLTPGYLFDAAGIGQSLGKARQSIDLLRNVHDGFPSFEKRVESAFLMAFIYQNDLNDRIQAKALYEQVIEKYPDDPWADQARASLATLDLTDDQLLEFLKEKNAAENP